MTEGIAPPRVVLAALGAVAVGVAVGHNLGAEELVHAPWYLYLAGFLLAIGLYGSTHDIDLGEMRRDLRVLVLAVTLGVLLKALLIAGVMVLVFRKPEYLVLGIAVAQIDPLSVAAMNKNRRMSPRAKSLLAAWASFDDPMTVLLTLYFSVLAFRLSDRSGGPAAGTVGEGSSAFLAGIGWNLVLLLAVALLWGVPRWWRRRARIHRATTATSRRGSGLSDGPSFVLALVMIAVAAGWMLMAAVAVAGLFLRVGRYGHVVQKAVSVAFVLAASVLGLLLAEGIAPWRGFVLGLAAFGAQVVIGLWIAPRLISGLGRSDRVQLGLGQQNGITAIILALALEPDFPGTVAIVGPAILTVNALYYLTNGAWARWEDRGGEHHEVEQEDFCGLPREPIVSADTAKP
ncbi:hypothetical protein ABZ348_23865 [Streptomyces sp. NPDC005963]|uniref:hypothetical protein n=1 Tax=Streptomyces sp. NPDC005963 TaxID=3156721 RepID=UPI0033E0BF45